MAKASAITIKIDAGKVPLLEGALELAAAGMLTSGDKTNREYIGQDIEIPAAVDENLIKLLYDPQTAGGMLISVPEERADDLLTRLRENYPRVEVIGRVTERTQHSIVMR